jgi:hypothetical protein
MSSHIWSTAEDVPCPRKYRAISARRVLVPVARPHIPLFEDGLGSSFDAGAPLVFFLGMTSGPISPPPPLASCVSPIRPHTAISDGYLRPILLLPGTANRAPMAPADETDRQSIDQSWHTCVACARARTDRDWTSGPSHQALSPNHASGLGCAGKVACPAIATNPADGLTLTV